MHIPVILLTLSGLAVPVWASPSGDTTLNRRQECTGLKAYFGYCGGVPRYTPTRTRTSMQAKPGIGPIALQDSTAKLCFEKLERVVHVRQNGAIQYPVQTECAWPSDYKTQWFRARHDVYDADHPQEQWPGAYELRGVVPTIPLERTPEVNRIESAPAKRVKLPYR
ncbi:MAG: hypothetical protein M1823_004661 [Watsoniomyces obsoletus]|nr:MAG: hypothetical protein M1823_004661 [Watsoniomyces obsoletus]